MLSVYNALRTFTQTLDATTLEKVNDIVLTENASENPTVENGLHRFGPRQSGYRLAVQNVLARGRGGDGMQTTPVKVSTATANHYLSKAELSGLLTALDEARE